MATEKDVSVTPAPQLSAVPRVRRAGGLQHFFLLCCVTFGLALALLAAPFQAPDEPQHFLRAYQVSEGVIVATSHGGAGGGDMPRSITRVTSIFQRVRSGDSQRTSWAEIQAALQIPLEPDEREFKEFPNTAIYSPLAYLPQAAGIRLGRAAGLGPLWLMYLARIANLMTWMLLGYAALAAAPDLRRPLLLLLLMPMSLFQAASVSGDALTNALATLIAALVWRQAWPQAGRPHASDSPRPLAARDLALLLVLTTALSLTKFAYWPLVGLLLLIPAERFGGRGKRLLAVGLFAAVGFIAVAAWSPFTRGLDAVIYNRPDINARRQLDFLLAHPGTVGEIARRTFLADSAFLLRSFVGRLGSVDIRLPMGFIVPYLAAMVIACSSVPCAANRPRLRRVLPVVLVSLCLSIGAIALLNYLFWTPVGEKRVKGMQGRHFIPLAPAAIVLVSALLQQIPRRYWSRVTPKQQDLIAIVVVMVCCVYTVLAVYSRYYGTPA